MRKKNIYLLTLSILLLAAFGMSSMTACGPGKKPEGTTNSTPNNNTTNNPDGNNNDGGNGEPDKLPKEAKPRCESIGAQGITLKNHELLISLWGQYNGLLQGFTTSSEALKNEAASYCTSSKGETEYNKLAEAYGKAYIAYRKVSVYKLKEFKDLAPVLSTSLPLDTAAIDTFATQTTFPTATDVMLHKAMYEKTIGFAPFDYVFFGPNKDKLKSESTRCDYLKLNAEVISESAQQLANEMKNRVAKLLSKGMNEKERKEKKKVIVDFLKVTYSTLDTLIESEDQLLKGSPSKEDLIKHLDAYYGKDSLAGVKATIDSIRKIYEGATSDRINFEKRLCLSDKAKTDDKEGRAQKVHDDFRMVELRLKALQETTLEDAHLSSDAAVKTKLTELNRAIEALRNALEIDFAQTVRLTEQGADNDGD